MSIIVEREGLPDALLPLPEGGTAASVGELAAAVTRTLGLRGAVVLDCNDGALDDAGATLSDHGIFGVDERVRVRLTPQAAATLRLEQMGYAVEGVEPGRGETIWKQAVTRTHVDAIQCVMHADLVHPDVPVTALRDAVCANDAELVALLVAAGVDVNADGKHGAAALGFAVRHASVEVVRALVRAGGMVDAQSFSGWTPLMGAVDSGRLAVARYLVEECHARVDITTNLGKTCLDVAHHPMADTGDRDAIIALLEAHGATLGTPMETPLVAAAPGYLPNKKRRCRVM